MLCLLAWCFLELLIVGVDVSLTLFPTLGTLSSYWVSLCSRDMWAFVLSYCFLFCPVLLLTLGDLLISEEKYIQYKTSGHEMEVTILIVRFPTSRNSVEKLPYRHVYLSPR